MSNDPQSFSSLSSIRPLTQEERQLAHSAGVDAIIRDIGERPQRDYFNQHSAHRYPPAVTRLISGLCIVLLLAAFTPSAIRLYVIGSQTFGASIPYEVAMVAVGIATVLTAEIGPQQAQQKFTAVRVFRFDHKIGEQSDCLAVGEGDCPQAAMLDLQLTEQGKTSSAKTVPDNDELTEIH